MTQPILTKKLMLPFKGKRQYLQSTTIFECLSDEIAQFLEIEQSDHYQLSLTFRHLLAKNIEMVMFENQPSFPDNAKDIIMVDFSLRGKLSYFGYLRESGSAVTRTIPDDDQNYANKFSISKQTISYTGPLSISLTSLIVIMSKYLHLNTVSNSGKWYVSRLNLPLRYHATDEINLSISIVKNLNSKLTQSDIIVNSTIVGSIQYILNQNAN